MDIYFKMLSQGKKEESYIEKKLFGEDVTKMYI